MLARFRLLGLIFLLAAAATLAQRAMSVAEVITFIKSQIKANGDDRATADYLKKIKLTQRLDERTIEELQGQGAGARTVAALKALATESANLPAPPPSVAATPPPPPPPPSAKEQAEVLDAMRDYAMNYTKNLPNYLCVQTTHRRQEPTDELRRKSPGRIYGTNADVIQEVLTFNDKMETYKVEAINGRSVTNIDHSGLGGVVSSGEFGTMMANIFDPESGAQFAWENWHTVRGKRMYAFSYHIDKEHGYSMLDVESHRSYTSAYKGLVYADRDTKEITVITLETMNIPPDFPIHNVKIRLDYDLIKVGEQIYMLPYHYQLDSLAEQASTTNEADFKLYRKYSADAKITFGDVDTDPVSPDTLKDVPDKKP